MRDLDGHTPLHKAVLCSQKDSLLALVMCGADVSNMDGNGYTALHVSHLLPPRFSQHFQHHTRKALAMLKSWEGLGIRLVIKTQFTTSLVLYTLIRWQPMLEARNY